MKNSWHVQASIFPFARTGKRVTHPLLAVILTFAFIALSIVCAELLSAPLSPVLMEIKPLFTHQPAVFSALAMIINLLSMFVFIYLLVWGWLAWFERRPFWTLGFFRQGIFSRYLAGLGSGLLMISLAAGIVLLLQGGHFLAVQGPMEGLPALGGSLLMVIGWVIQASAEEVLYRGWLLPVISLRSRLWIGVLLSALCFAGTHVLNKGFSPLVFANLVLFGIFLALYRLVDGSLWGVCAWHTSWNWALGNLYGVNNAGGAPEGGSLFHLGLVGPEWLSGGIFGLEGSIATTIVFLLGIGAMLIAIFWRRRNGTFSIEGQVSSLRMK
ncbi:CPBP family intramembrane metalloprotease [Ktedonosporobacter rubrisoli]|uniref:CPBP family intramembrane metalloprotease n=1 Tax=Ktedonosporobacter rubrisoli TaxID=2509675 RepID=A0A4P6JS01_KTERU|nr:type II CAAX endopeptidase family protein [Ktedonosporobacter rubrisoli]QBD77596.1 CPBP family intramembrane metalloprotease [Ktedonosporobacter rubrisoli]